MNPSARPLAGRWSSASQTSRKIASFSINPAPQFTLIEECLS